MPKGLVWLIAAIATIAAVGLLPAFIGNKDADAVSAGSIPAASGARIPQPGPAQPGKVWSAEHGHWHDAPTRTVIPAGGMPAGGNNSPVQIQTSTVAAQPPSQPVPQPPGPAPAGKVWSPEHGHWHDVPAAP